ncbi:oxidoreductase [Deinococcus cellulosilyticus]|uniref:Short-chain dehydrogenase n=1 Tax=Deinococcus cellulosilyticus (strain DSM 18568 / NBRC 106333 / KACC 11606 / 5516J-15) TaxID=1223518 RepID=A0A511N5K4_DEIC1|nr:oxidoreductase [Deinococcus cellulosilyticus]GEM48140.1 short-chain dehydrogenase [Deinococcus cellulosilyticus NBRC 106333 = KACC 11606]
MNEQPWTLQQMPSQKGKTVIVTGANSGLGLETVKAFAARDARVILAVRNTEAGERVVSELQEEHPRSKVTVMALDLADLKSVRDFAQKFQQEHSRLDLLINNAGVMAIPHRTTKDGFEMQFGTNHLGHFALTGQVLPALLATPGSRIINVSSRAHVIGRMNFNDLMGNKRYSPWLAYGQSKLANLLFTLELQRQLKLTRAETLAVSCHPGWSATNLQYVAPQMTRSSLMLRLNQLANQLFSQPASEGVLPTLYAATSSTIEGGEYIGPHRDTKGYPVRVRANPRAYDAGAAKQLWSISEDLTGVQYSFSVPAGVQ